MIIRVGDRVKLKDGIEIGRYDGVFFTPPMLDLIGKAMTVEQVRADYVTIVGIPWCFSEIMLEVIGVGGDKVPRKKKGRRINYDF